MVAKTGQKKGGGEEMSEKCLRMSWRHRQQLPVLATPLQATARAVLDGAFRRKAASKRTSVRQNARGGPKMLTLQVERGMLHRLCRQATTAIHARQTATALHNSALPRVHCMFPRTL